MSDKCRATLCKKEVVDTCDHCDDKYCDVHITEARDPNGEVTSMCHDCIYFYCRM